MLLSDVFVLVAAQPSSEFPEGIKNYPVLSSYKEFLYKRSIRYSFRAPSNASFVYKVAPGKVRRKLFFKFHFTNLLKFWIKMQNAR
jgi:hypothetical protein